MTDITNSEFIPGIADAGTLYMHPNRLGSIQFVTNEAGEIVYRTFYTPYGERVQFDSSHKDYALYSANRTTHYGFTGQEEDNTGLMNYGARLYDPQIGRFIQADTVVPDPLSVHSYNRYMYCAGNPVFYTDPTGHSEETNDYGDPCDGWGDSGGGADTSTPESQSPTAEDKGKEDPATVTKGGLLNPEVPGTFFRDFDTSGNGKGKGKGESGSGSMQGGGPLGTDYEGDPDDPGNCGTPASGSSVGGNEGSNDKPSSIVHILVDAYKNTNENNNRGFNDAIEKSILKVEDSVEKISKGKSKASKEFTSILFTFGKEYGKGYIDKDRSISRLLSTGLPVNPGNSFDQHMCMIGLFGYYEYNLITFFRGKDVSISHTFNSSGFSAELGLTFNQTSFSFSANIQGKF